MLNIHSIHLLIFNYTWQQQMSHLTNWTEAMTSHRVACPLLPQAAISRNTSTYSSTVTQNAAFFAPSH